jgi:hypothetical protein
MNGKIYTKINGLFECKHLHNSSRLLALILLNLLVSATVFSQVPEKISYQAIVRDAGNNLVTNKTVGMQISILQGSATGTPVYVETHTPGTDINGMISIEIGGGTVVSGNFTTIGWASGSYYIKTETDPTGGTTYTITGTSQLLSVPYSLHAKTAENISGTITETDPVFVASAANGISSMQITNWNASYGWGNHANGGYLKNETDPLFSGSFNLTSPANNQLLKYNSTSGKWENWTPGFITAEVDGSITNEIELPVQTGNSGKFLSTNGTSLSWLSIDKSTLSLGNVENTALSTWTGTANITTLGTISSGTWQGTAINASYVDNLPASKITSGTFDNTRINWAAPGTIGSTTPSSGAFTSLSASNGLSVSAGTVNIKPSGSGGTSGQVLSTDGTGNATWQTLSRSVRTISANTTLTTTDEVVIISGAYTATLPASPTNGQVLMICGTNSSGGIDTNGKTLTVLNSSNPSSTFTFAGLGNNLLILVYDSSGTWHLNF